MPISAIVGERQGVWIENSHEAWGAAPMLDVRPAIFGNGGHVKAVARPNEIGFFSSQFIQRRCGIESRFGYSVIMLLSRSDGVGSGNAVKICGHMLRIF